MNNEVMFSSKKQNYETPQDLFDALDDEFNFDIDVCAEDETAKCENYYTKEDDALTKEWNGVCWMNPPYNDIETWIKKAYKESKKGATVVCLIPARTDTKAWINYCMKAKEIRFIRGRLKFGNCKDAAPFPSAIIVFKGRHMTPVFNTYSKNKDGEYGIEYYKILVEHLDKKQKKKKIVGE